MELSDYYPLTWAPFFYPSFIIMAMVIVMVKDMCISIRVAIITVIIITTKTILIMARSGSNCNEI